MIEPQWTEAQRLGCGIVIVALAVLFALPLSVYLWKLALGWR